MDKTFTGCYTFSFKFIGKNFTERVYFIKDVIAKTCNKCAYVLFIQLRPPTPRPRLQNDPATSGDLACTSPRGDSSHAR